MTERKIFNALKFFCSHFNVPNIFIRNQPKTDKTYRGVKRTVEEVEEEEAAEITERLTFKKIADIERPMKFRTLVSRLRNTSLVFMRRRKPLQSTVTASIRYHRS